MSDEKKLPEVESHVTDEADNHQGYEKLDVNMKSVISVSIVGFLGVITIIFILTQYFTAAKEKQIYNAVLKPESLSARDLKAAEAEILGSYKVLDAKKGVYQIPIERAMALVADESFKASQQGEQQPVALAKVATEKTAKAKSTKPESKK
jgi:hypothetical protein